MTAIGVMRQAYDQNIKIPDDLSVVGFDDIRIAEFTIPPLTTAQVSQKELAKIAFEALLNEVEGRTGKLLHVAEKAFRPEEFDRFHRLIVRIMAGPAPHLTIALSGASASGQLLHMTDDLELLRVRTVWRDIAVSGENILQALPRPKIAKLLSRIKYSANSQQVTLFADAVASSRLQLRRIDDRARSGITEVLFSQAMTTLTGDRFR
jgi:hypothetical protein